MDTDTATQAGLDKAAQILADRHAELVAEYADVEYIAGVTDALDELIRAGATVPR